MVGRLRRLLRAAGLDPVVLPGRLCARISRAGLDARPHWLRSADPHEVVRAAGKGAPRPALCGEAMREGRRALFVPDRTGGACAAFPAAACGFGNVAAYPSWPRPGDPAGARGGL